MIPDPKFVAESITDALRNTNPLLDAIAAARTRADEATATVRAIKAALSDLEDDAAVEALEDPTATNDAKRKTVAGKWLKGFTRKADGSWQPPPEGACVPYQDLRAQLATATAAETTAKADLEDAERRLKTHERSLPALVVLGEMVCQQEARQTEQIRLEGQRLYRQAGADIRVAAEAQLAARQGVTRG